MKQGVILGFLLFGSVINSYGQRTKPLSGVYVGGGMSMALPGQVSEGGQNHVYRTSAKSYTLGSGYLLELGGRISLNKNLFVDVKAKGFQSFEFSYETQLAPNQEVEDNTLRAQTLIFMPGIGTRSNLGRTAGLSLIVGPNIGLAAIDARRGVVESGGEIFNAAKSEIRGGHIYGFRSSLMLDFGLSEKLKLIMGIEAIYSIYKPNSEELVELIQTGQKTDISAWPRAQKERSFVEDPQSVSFTDNDPLPVAQQLYNLSSVAFKVHLLYSF